MEKKLVFESKKDRNLYNIAKKKVEDTSKQLSYDVGLKNRQI